MGVSLCEVIGTAPDLQKLVPFTKMFEKFQASPFAKAKAVQQAKVQFQAARGTFATLEAEAKKTTLDHLSTLSLDPASEAELRMLKRASVTSHGGQEAGVGSEAEEARGSAIE